MKVFHPDGRHCLVATEVGDGQRDSTPGLHFVDSWTGREVSQWKESIPSQVRFNRDGQCVLLDQRWTGAKSHWCVNEFDALQGTSRELLRLPYRHITPIITPDGRTLLSPTKTEGREVIEVWDLDTGKLRATLDTDGRPQYSMASSADGQWLAFPDAVRENQVVLPRGIQMWDLNAGSRVGNLTDYDGVASVVEFDSSSRKLRLFTYRRTRDQEEGLPLDEYESRLVTYDMELKSFQDEPNNFGDGRFEMMHEDEGWRLGRTSLSPLMVRDPQGRLTLSLSDRDSQQVLEGWFERGTELIAIVFERDAPIISRWLVQIPRVGARFRATQRGEFRLVNRRTGESVWQGTWTRGKETRLHCVSPNGQRLAEILGENKHTTVRFWTIPPRRWHRWVAGVLGIVAAALTWWFVGRSRAVVSDSARDQV